MSNNNGEQRSEQHLYASTMSAAAPPPPMFSLRPLGPAVQELKTAPFWRDVLIEFIVNFLFLYFGICTCITLSPVGSQGHVVAGLVFGVYVFGLVEAFGHLNHMALNPVVSLLQACTGTISIIKMLVYTVFQMLGSVAGSLCAKACTPVNMHDRVHRFGPRPGVSKLGCFVAEMLATFMLVFVIIGSGDAARRPVFMSSLAVGLVVMVNIISVANFSGGSMNPALSLGFDAVAEDFEDVWLYFLAEYLGAIVAMLLYFMVTYDRGILKKPKRDLNGNLRKDDEAKLGEGEEFLEINQEKHH